ncbi:MAG: hypothetical protein IKY83_00195 [Proteobacteria bacterium]|nr:hypothetical protein [Pseudomonadota bacterium]
MKKLTLLAIATALLMTACGDANDNENNSTTPQDNQTAVDFTKFCNVVMGKVCGDAISDADIASCVSTYKAEAAKYASTCKEVGDKYYKCVIHADAQICEDNDTSCKAEIEAYSKCIGEPAEEEIDFNAFCNIVMGKACGANISDADIASCISVYKADYDTYASTCKEVGDKYYKCVIKADTQVCADDDHSCEAEIEAYSECIGEPAEEIDFNAFCNIVMGKACGAEISDADIASCVSTYKAESEKYASTCKEVGDKYYQCVIDADTQVCEDDDTSCEAEIAAYSACTK